MEPAKRRILFLITTADWGGAQRFVFDAARECQRRGHSVMVAKGEHGELGERCAIAGIPSTTLETVRRQISPLHDLASIYEIRRLIRQFKPDVVHLNSSKIGVVGSIACHMERVKKTIYRIGGWAFLEELPSWKRAFYLWSERATAQYKDIIVTVHPGDEEVARLKKIRPRGMLMTIANGIDLATFDQKLKSRYEARKALGVREDRFVIGTIANFYPPKNIPWFLRTIATMERDPRSTVVVIGDGPDRALVEKTAKEIQLGDALLFAGRRNDASELLSAFDLFVLPSTKEGMPWTLLEAMAAKLPCIATDVGACKWMLEGDAGVIVPSNDATALTAAITQLTSDEARRATLGAHARNAVETRFRWETTIQKTLEILEKD